MTVYTSTSTRSLKYRQIKRDPRVTVYYSDHMKGVPSRGRCPGVTGEVAASPAGSGRLRRQPGEQPPDRRGNDRQQ